MHTTLRKLLIALPLTLLFSAACWAQTTTIEGDVKGEDGKPLQNALIKIDRKDIKGSYKVKTDKKGHYLYAGLPIGTYKITVEVGGQDKDFTDNVRSHTGDPTTMNFNLQERASRGGPPEQEVDRSKSPEQRAADEKKRKEAESQLAKNKALNDAFNAGKDAANAKNWDVAIDNFQKATEMDAAQHVVWANLGDALVNQAKTKTGADQETALQKASAAYQKAIELKPDDSTYHNNYALVLAQAKKFSEAQAELTKAAQLDPSQAGKYYYNLGAVLVNTNQLEAAAEAFRKAIEIDPNYADAHYQLGLSLMSKATATADGKMTAPPGTAESFQKYLELQPSGPNADAAKAMLTSLGSTVETQFAKPQPQKKK